MHARCVCCAERRISADKHMDGTTQRFSEADHGLRCPGDSELPMFVDNDEKFPEEYVVAELTLADKKRSTQRYLVGRYSWPRHEIECEKCREADVPCLVDIHKNHPNTSGCSLCSLHRAPCSLYINEDEDEDDEEEEKDIEQVATTTSVTLRSAAGKPNIPQDERHGEVHILPHRLGDKEDEAKYAANVIVAYVEKAETSSRYVVGVYGAPTNEVECETCHYASTRKGTRCPCLRSGEKRRGCVLCGLRRAPGQLFRCPLVSIWTHHCVVNPSQRPLRPRVTQTRLFILVKSTLRSLQ
ncbi:hypothetical protein FA95DRAFT_1098578 [Auriscalpium vulgare]|uniref:Uncharacterized protein n=1 Tax=Auriscalpium vulgare TaxID=40419 RepID=A0ACB8RVM1_9AGAM|nr:hypothetical protein FA95DRAFT_1098578 [Auriscalpium vulgare]